MKEVVLSFAGWQDPGSRVHQAIARLRVGDELRYIEDERGVRLDDVSGTTVGRLSKDFAPPPGLHCHAARVRAILIWRKLDNALEYQDRCRSERWEVVLPELIFEPKYG